MEIFQATKEWESMSSIWKLLIVLLRRLLEYVSYASSEQFNVRITWI